MLHFKEFHPNCSLKFNLVFFWALKGQIKNFSRAIFVIKFFWIKMLFEHWGRHFLHDYMPFFKSLTGWQKATSLSSHETTMNRYCIFRRRIAMQERKIGKRHNTGGGVYSTILLSIFLNPFYSLFLLFIWFFIFFIHLKKFKAKNSLLLAIVFFLLLKH